MRVGLPETDLGSSTCEDAGGRGWRAAVGFGKVPGGGGLGTPTQADRVEEPGEGREPTERCGVPGPRP